MSELSPRSDRVRSVRALAHRSVRERQGLFLAEGPQAVREALRYRPDLVRDLYVTDQAAQRYASDLAVAADVRRQRVSEDVLAAMADAHTPQGLLAVCRVPHVDLEAVLTDRPRLVCVLAHVRDPGNAGTVLRAADAAGADAVVVTSASVDVFAPKTVRSTAGSLFHLPVVTGVPVLDAVSALRTAGMRVLAADGSGAHELGRVPLEGRHAWLFGNEAWGLRPEELDACDESVRVPIRGRAESLNLAMAATVCLFASAVAQSSTSTGAP